MSILDATTGETFDTIGAAITGSNAGDVIQIPAGTYVEDIPRITHNLTIEGVGGMPHLEAPAAGLANDEGIFLITGAAVTVQGIEFSGAAGPSGNDAAIRLNREA